MFGLVRPQYAINVNQISPELRDLLLKGID
jgi:hypothetical protein